MVEILRKRLNQFGNSVGVTLPARWLRSRDRKGNRKRFLILGNYVDMLVFDNAIIILDGETEFDNDIIIDEIHLAKKIVDLEDEKKQIEFLKEFKTKEERDEVRKNWKETEKSPDKKDVRGM